MKVKLPVPKTSSGLKPKAGSMLSANCIFNGRFVTALTPLDAETAATLPAKFWRYLIDDTKADADDGEPASLNYTIGVQYDVDGNGLRRPKHIQREIIDLQLAQRQQELLEQDLSEPSEQERMAMQIIQEDHESLVNRDRAEGEFRMKEQANAEQFAKEFIEEDQMDVTESVVSSAVEEIPEPESEPKPRRGCEDDLFAGMALGCASNA